MIASRHMNFKGLLLAATILPGPLIITTPIAATAQIGAVITYALPPPVLPVYAQPPMPEDGYIWTPGYWQWAAPAGYYWIPGTWIMPPAANVLWTPPYWGWSDGLYLFHAGYWGPHVGFYGGVNYGYGYGGSGFQGGRWEGGHFAYNQSVNNFGSVRVTNAYRQNVTVNNATRISYTGGTGGIKAEPTAADREAEHDTHLPVTPEQSRHFTAAAGHPGLVAAHNNGRPAIAATARPAQFQGPGVVRPQATHATVAHLAPHQVVHPAAPRAAEHMTQRPAPSQAAPHQEASRGGAKGQER
jgi:WXXGXW repeat (2 copies)